MNHVRWLRDDETRQRRGDGQEPQTSHVSLPAIMTQLSIVGWYHLAFFGVLIPIAAIRSHAKIASGAAPMDRMRHFQSTAVMLVFFGAVSVLTARRQHWLTMFRVADPIAVLRTLPVAIAMYIVAVVLMRPRWRRAVERRARIVHLFMPENATERAWWIAVSVLAGVSEEITWRGVQTALITGLV